MSEKKSILTLKSTNERIDDLEKRIETIPSDSFASLKKTQSGLIAYLIAITIIFTTLITFTLVSIPKSTVKKEQWTLFTTPAFPEWLEIEKEDDSITLLIDEKSEKILMPGDEYTVLEHRTRLKLVGDDYSILLYGNNTLYGGFWYQE